MGRIVPCGSPLVSTKGHERILPLREFQLDDAGSRAVRRRTRSRVVRVLGRAQAMLEAASSGASGPAVRPVHIPRIEPARDTPPPSPPVSPVLRRTPGASLSRCPAGGGGILSPPLSENPDHPDHPDQPPRDAASGRSRFGGEPGPPGPERNALGVAEPTSVKGLCSAVRCGTIEVLGPTPATSRLRYNMSAFYACLTYIASAALVAPFAVAIYHLF